MHGVPAAQLNEPEPTLRPAAGRDLKLRIAGATTMEHADSSIFSYRTAPFRAATRSDFDGLVCAALLKELGLIYEILFVHPKDVQDGKVELTADDITTNLPVMPGGRAVVRPPLVRGAGASGEDTGNWVLAADAHSAARVVYDYLGGVAMFPRVSVAMMEAVDGADAAQWSMDYILNPEGWTRLSFLMDLRALALGAPQLPHVERPADDAPDR